MRYTYLGDRMTAPELKGAQCEPVRRADGKCIVTPRATQLVEFTNGARHVVVRRRLRVNRNASADVLTLGE